MKKLLIACCVTLFLSGCASPTDQQLNFTPQADNIKSTITQAKTLSLSTTDIRTAQYVALVNKGEDKALPIHAKQNTRTAFNSAFATLLQSQGFVISNNSDNSVEVEIEQVLVRVNSATFSNDMDAKITLKVTAETPTGKFVKTYTGSAKANNSMGASNEQIEHILNHVSKLVLNDIANDVELINYMEDKFQ
ncbi:YajG family lipoprotein [Vibrio rarus]|uniref:YajG family lipoprotein n=1 Tax=Vibrio rarus TaxID=413403 RepID=UPI0021C28A74|nr:YajG family lipoprotein [Vibrio rarus]